MIQASDDEIDGWMTAALTGAGAPVADHLPRGREPAGEARNLHVGGGRYVSLLGQSGPWFHHPDDRYPGAVTADAACVTAADAAAAGVQALLPKEFGFAQAVRYLKSVPGVRGGVFVHWR